VTANIRRGLVSLPPATPELDANRATEASAAATKDLME